MRHLNLVLLAVASLALFLMLRGIDWSALSHSFRHGRRYWGLLFLPYGVTCYFWSVSWRLLLSDEAAPSMHRLFSLRLAGDSLNQLTPTASLGGEPYKALRLKARGVPWQEATASLVIHKALSVLSLVLYIFIALALIPLSLPGISTGLATFSWLGTLLLAAGAVSFVIIQRRNPCIFFINTLKKWGMCPAILVEKEAELASLDQQLSAFYRQHPRAALMALFFYFLGWTVQSLEVWLIFWLLGHPIPLHVAFCLDALAQLAAGLGFMIPASLGVQEGGNILLSLGFRLGATLGAGFSILRRVREAFWLLLGLLVVVKEK